MRIIVKKVKVMCISHKGGYKLKIKQDETVKVYLGSEITEDGYIKSRIAMGNNTFVKKKSTDKQIGSGTQKENCKSHGVERRIGLDKKSS